MFRDLLKELGPVGRLLEYPTHIWGCGSDYVTGFTAVRGDADETADAVSENYNYYLGRFNTVSHELDEKAGTGVAGW